MLSDSIWILPVLPALGALLNGLTGKNRSEKGITAIAVGAMALALAAALFFATEMFMQPAGTHYPTAILYRWLSVGDLQISVGLALDRLSLVMVLVVLFVGFLIHLYSAGYMKGDPGYRRFFFCLNLFVFFMLVLVLADNLALTFVGWEGVGLCSYLLIGFWYEKTSAANAGRKAFVVNRIGDFGFILGTLLAASTFGTLNYSDIGRLIATGPAVQQGVLAAIALLLFVGAMGKSAQFPLHVWLPDAMEGPTPVSALIHAATMVNAGVYLMCRIAPLLNAAPVVLPVIATVGLITALYASFSALGQSDIKRVLAYSTVSQIGYMFVAIGCGLYSAGMFHLMTHGIFKGLLFLSAGAVIHALNGEQRLQNMGGLVHDLPSVSVCFMTGLLALAGIFPLSGFFSKDAILWAGFEHYGKIFWMVAFGGALMTAVYSGKLFSVFLGGKRFDGHLHHPGPVMLVPLIILAVCAVLAGIPGLPLFSADTYFARFLGIGAATPSGETAGHLTEMILTVVQTLLIIGFLVLAVRRFTKMERFGELPVLESGFGIDRFYELIFVRIIKGAARLLATVVDRLIIDGAVNGLALASMTLGKISCRIQTGELRHYAVSLITGAFALLAVAVFLIGGF